MQRPDQTNASPESTASEGRLVAKNMAYLAAAQLLTIPLSVVMNALYARYLGPAEFGLIYLASTMCAFGILLIEWGQQGVLPALIARDRSQAAGLLGTGFAWRGMAACVIYLVLAGVSLALGHGDLFQWVFLSCFLTAVLNSLAGGYKDSIRGFERTDIPAIAHVAQQLVLFIVVAAVFMLGGRLNAVLILGIFVPLITVIGLSRISKRVGIGPLEVRRANFWVLLTLGTPFVFNDIVMTLQPIVDAMYLSRLAPEEAVGWYAATRRLIGMLILPATALIASLYPTLCRLWAESRNGYAGTVVGALNGIAVLAVPAALGCALFPEVGVSIFGAKNFSPAEDNLRVMAVFLFLVYFSMPISAAVLAAGKLRVWAILQAICLLLSVVLDPLLIPWFQERTGNGSMGLCVAAVISESLVVIVGLTLLPRGVLDRSVPRTVALAVLSGVPMAIIAIALQGTINPFILAPLAALAYLATALMCGAITRSQRDAVFGVLRRRLARR
jgi:O-antigen/teichoic acid export membrane protein